MKYATVCSGIEAPSVAWKHLGWKAEWFSEIDQFPSSVLSHHYPNVPNLGDMTKLKDNDIFKERRIDLLCGGTPCQSFSLAGLRKGLDDPRGNLALTFLSIVEELKPRWVIWENVPGVLSSYTTQEEDPDGEWQTQDLDTFVRAFRQIGYGVAYRVLDAQFFGVPQRRRRVFVVGYLGDWRCSAAVLFERESMSGDIEARRKERKASTGRTEKRIAPTIDASIDSKWGSNQWVDSKSYFIEGVYSNTGSSTWSDGINVLRGKENDSHEKLVLYGGSNQSGPLSVSPSLTAHPGPRNDFETEGFVVFQSKASSTQSMNPSPVSPTLDKSKSDGIAVNNKGRVRRLMPVECERLQGFPDNYTKIPYRGRSADNCPDGPRYKAIGNSMAIPVMKWIGDRIDFVEKEVINGKQE